MTGRADDAGPQGGQTPALPVRDYLAVAIGELACLGPRLERLGGQLEAVTGETKTTAAVRDIAERVDMVHGLLVTFGRTLPEYREEDAQPHMDHDLGEPVG